MRRATWAGVTVLELPTQIWSEEERLALLARLKRESTGRGRPTELEPAALVEEIIELMDVDIVIIEDIPPRSKRGASRPPPLPLRALRRPPPLPRLHAVGPDIPRKIGPG